ncbi:chemotaxis protein CheX [Geothermobacter ehrlichii]|uniref:Chemotaxis protein CheX n=1 Tax=Geothermobacter ehrlichii TaxID=213224 RepID=A0A5D3WNW5_9BACT|nr:chemotaxis protein CheX [Geothermobacter ehrlichii]TYP00225.1 chemotaxis protein CheX [Geothermobacter ehrlichii]
MDYRKFIIDGTREIFETMLMAEVSPGQQKDVQPEEFERDLTSMVGMAGACRGMLAIHCPKPIALAITGALLGIELDDVCEDVFDAMGEMANMIAGNVKAVLCNKGLDVSLSIPSVVSGPDFQVDSLVEGSRTVVAFDTQGGEFLVELRLEETAVAA